MMKAGKSSIQIGAQNQPDPSEFVAELRSRLKCGGLTRPDPVTAHVERMPAFRELSKLVRGFRNLPKLMSSQNWCLVGNAAAIAYGTTRFSDNIDVLVDGVGNAYRNLENVLVKAGWEPIFSDQNRTKYYPAYVVRSWWLTSDAKKYNVDQCRRLNLVVPAGAAQIKANDLITKRLNNFPLAKKWKLCSADSLFAIKAHVFRSVDIADLVEIIQGGAKIDWQAAKSLSESAGLDHTALLDTLRVIMEEMPDDNKGFARHSSRGRK